jgi:hypothetical protein
MILEGAKMQQGSFLGQSIYGVCRHLLVSFVLCFLSLRLRNFQIIL